MDRIGEYIGLRRKQEPDYDFENYVEELERGETKDPEEESSQSIRSALLNMTKASDAISMVIDTFILTSLKTYESKFMLIDLIFFNKINADFQGISNDSRLQSQRNSTGASRKTDEGEQQRRMGTQNCRS